MGQTAEKLCFVAILSQGAWYKPELLLLKANNDGSATINVGFGPVFVPVGHWHVMAVPEVPMTLSEVEWTG